MFCRKCGKPIPDGAKFCPYCGADQNYKEVYTRKKVDYNASKYSRTLALIFACIGFVAIGGIHRFYVGKIGVEYRKMNRGKVVVVCRAHVVDARNERKIARFYLKNLVSLP